MSASDPPCDWQDSSHYHYVADLDRAGLAWEFVRRDPAYRAAVVRLGRVTDQTGSAYLLSDGLSDALPWGLSFRRAPRCPGG
jgi:hypothetical protein